MGKFFGKYRVVINNKDPMGRIKVECPKVRKFESEWCLPFPTERTESGRFRFQRRYLVWIEFEEGDQISQFGLEQFGNKIDPLRTNTK